MLSSVIEAATSDDVAVSTLLRRVKVVATRLGTSELDEWVNSELGGYTDVADLPPYRGPFGAEVVGHFVGPFSSEVQLPIPSRVLLPHLPEYAQEIFKVRFQQPIAELEELADLKKQLQSPWPADLVALINGKISTGALTLIEMHNLATAHRVISAQQLRGVVDAVKTRVLGLALDLEKLNPEAGEPGSGGTDSAAVTTVVFNHIYGEGNNIAIASRDVAQHTERVREGDLESLIAALKQLGTEDADIQTLQQAITDDAAESTEPGPGPRVRDYIGTALLRTGGAAGKVGIGAAGGTLAAVIKAYYGIG